jgi:dienelactone hydrolase
VQGLLIFLVSIAFSASPQGQSSAPLATHAEPVTVASRDGTRLAGTLAFPSHSAGRLPAVLLLHGGGAMNRDEQIGPNKPFAQISDALVRAGYVVLRYDKRGVPPTSGAPMTRARLLEDASAAFDLLAREPRVDAHRIFAIGHSEGGELVLGLAAERPVRGLVLLAPLPKPYRLELADQMGRLPGDRAAIADLMKANAAFFDSYDGIDPRAEIAATRQPVLLLHGKKDVHVLERDIAALNGAARQAHRDITYRELPNDNHFFMVLEGDRMSTGREFGDPSPFDTQALRSIVLWLNTSARP